MTNLYSTDFYAWTQEQANLLRQGKVDYIDVINLIEEIESLGKQQKQELKNRLGVLLGRLLKWNYQSDRRSKSWKYSIQEQRLQILDLLEENLSLKPYLEEAVSKAYQLGLLLIGRETPLDPKELPIECPYALDRILDPSFPEDLESMSVKFDREISSNVKL
ncbi:MAG: DUF29 domain-containing protein [Cyanosarcina radialis HA8281-LM2]|nr:DUF29 domain-containing protein [Cyanosarcina radialis HA8281-LM2]